MASSPKRIKLDLIKWYPILSNELLTTNFKFYNYFIATILDKKQIGKITDCFNQKYPLRNNFYKRIRHSIDNNNKTLTDILITESDNCKEIKIPNEIEQFIIDLREIQLPNFEPQTRKQFNLISKYWPLKFHENKEIEILINNKFNLSSKENDLINHDKYARLILKYSKLNHNKPVSMIVDPSVDQVLSIGLDERDQHPLNHSTIITLNQVSKKQLVLNGDDANDDSIKFLKNESSIKIKESDPINYLCTNYYAYLTHEPCSMCAMALVHSRISKVFYLNNVEHGYLFSKCKIHTVNSLNHKFQVFKATNFDSNIEENSELYFSIKN